MNQQSKGPDIQEGPHQLTESHGDLMQLTAALVAIPSESFKELAITDIVEADLRVHEHLDVTRVGDNLVARTTLGRPTRVILAGHTDTVPADDNAEPRIENDTLWGLGSADMKGGLAVMVDLAGRLTRPAVDVTYVFYAREEVAAVHSGLGELFELRPDLLEGDIAILGEPTDGDIEAGCQGTLRLRVTVVGQRAHTARAWMGRNAIHRLAGLLAAISAYEPRQPIIKGCAFHEALQVVRIEGGVAGNVVPDLATVDVAHRFAPDRSASEAEDHVRQLLAEHLESDDLVELVDVSNAAPPAVDHPVVKAMIERHGLNVRAKLGWTDVARFTQKGVPAVNLGPGESSLAHTRDERLEHDSLRRTHAVIEEVLSNGV